MKRDLRSHTRGNALSRRPGKGPTLPAWRSGLTLLFVSFVVPCSGHTSTLHSGIPHRSREDGAMARSTCSSRGPSSHPRSGSVWSLNQNPTPLSGLHGHQACDADIHAAETPHTQNKQMIMSNFHVSQGKYSCFKACCCSFVGCS